MGRAESVESAGREWTLIAAPFVFMVGVRVERNLSEFMGFFLIKNADKDRFFFLAGEYENYRSA